MALMIRDCLLIFLITVLLFLGIEMLSGFFVKPRTIHSMRFIAERVHTEYDPLLGWINKPNSYVEDMYGPGKYLRTNAQRFRGDREYDPNVIKGEKRFICSGDSFTLGYGVGNPDTWCALLEAQMPNIETINMGQGGYGIDQAYLWYTRDGTRLKHDTLIFAFNTLGFGRMAWDRLSTYPKPLLDVRDGKIMHRNNPVPKPNYLTRWLPRYEAFLSDLNVMRLIKRVKNWNGYRNPSKGNGWHKTDINQLTSALFQSLVEQARESGSRVKFVFLPLKSDCRQEASQTNNWRRFLQLNAKKHGWDYIDLIKDYCGLDPHSTSRLFIKENIENYLWSAGHYSEEGNQYVAELLRAHLNK